ncbi:MAG: sensor histidine kinase [Jatrophihabitans sp.]|uniref:sensor histidine kinase n=1 Tax=Jatrophihabitans sp. TaxID=1932789 RepID=UPI00390F526B
MTEHAGQRRVGPHAALVTGALLLTVTSGCVSLWVRSADGGRLLVPGLLAVDATAFALVGAVVALARPGNRIGWLMLAGGMGMEVGIALLELADRSLLHAPGSVPGASAWAVIGSDVRALAWLVLTIAIPMYFPDGSAEAGRWRWLPRLFLVTLGAQLIGSTFASHAQVTELHEWHNPLSTSALNAVADPASGLGLLLAAGTALGAVAQLVSRYRRSSALRRQQIGMLAAGAAFALIAAPLSVAGLGGAWAFAVTLLPIPFVLGFAVLARDLYDLATAANRTLVWVTLSAVIVGIYALVIAGVGSVLDRRGASWLPWIGAAAVAISFAPLRDSLQRGVNRLMFGRWDDPYEVLAALGQNLEASADVDRLLADVAMELEATLALRNVRIEDSRGHVLAGSTQSDGAARRLPLVAFGAPVGTLSYVPTTLLRPRDVTLLHDLAGHIGGLLHAHGLNAELRTARERLVRAREEERRRLRRDLHDGLGPALAGHLLRLEVAARALEPASEAARSLALLRDEMRATMIDVRRVVEGLRPPALDELGLVGALRETLARLTVGSTVEVGLEADEVPALPAAVEVAVFRIVNEAVTNVVRHSGAGRCAVRLQGCGDTLRLCVDDDGRGLTLDAGAGHGLDTMRERAEEIGGTLAVVSTVGTRIQAEIPLARRSQ